MTTAPLFNGTATHDVRDEKSGRFANRRKAGQDLPLFGADFARDATPSVLAPRKSKDGKSVRVQGSPFVTGKITGQGLEAEVKYLSGRKLDRAGDEAAAARMARGPKLI